MCFQEASDMAKIEVPTENGLFDAQLRLEAFDRAHNKICSKYGFHPQKVRTKEDTKNWKDEEWDFMLSYYKLED